MTDLITFNKHENKNVIFFIFQTHLNIVTLIISIP